MTRDEMIARLWEMGFRSHSTASQKWRMALFHANTERTMVILIRSRGVDLLVTTLSRADMTNENGLLSISTQRDGDGFGEYSYTESNLDIHRKIVDAAALFVQNEALDQSYFTHVGIGRTEWARKHGEKSKRQQEGGLYEALAYGDGEPVYLGDGIWIGPGDSIEDRS